MNQTSLFDLPASRPRKRPESPVVRELQRRESNRDRVLARLQQGPATTMQLIAVGGARAIGRVFELKRAGYDIATIHVEGGLWRYELRTR
jgi:hypothetical protein